MKPAQTQGTASHQKHWPQTGCLRDIDSAKNCHIVELHLVGVVIRVPSEKFEGGCRYIVGRRNWSEVEYVAGHGRVLRRPGKAGICCCRSIEKEIHLGEQGRSRAVLQRIESQLREIQYKSGISGNCERGEYGWIERPGSGPIFASENVRVTSAGQSAVSSVITERGAGWLGIGLICGQTVVRARTWEIVGVDKAGLDARTNQHTSSYNEQTELGDSHTDWQCNYMSKPWATDGLGPLRA